MVNCSMYGALRCSSEDPLHFLLCLPIMLPSPPADASRINLTSTSEVNYWCQALNCTETRLRNAVLAVGLLVADVQAYLQR